MLLGQITGAGALGLLLALGAPPVSAETVQVTIMAEGAPSAPVSWSAVPLDLAPDEDVLDAMIMTPESIVGPWQVALLPGDYLISGFAEVDLYELSVTITDQTKQIAVPVLALEPSVALRCAQATGCDFVDPDTGLAAALPQGWAVDVPYRADLGTGALAPEISTVFFEDTFEEGAEDGGAVWFLNPVDWIDDDASPCREVALGRLCTFEQTPEALAAFEVIAPSLRVAP